MELSIVIPAHNEAARLPAMLEAYARHFADHMPGATEILVVANNCDDDTVGAANAVARDYPAIRVIDEPARTGKGGAIIIGTRQAQGDWIGFVDADGATPPEEFERLFRQATPADGVIASRWKRGANVTIHQKRLRLLTSRLFNGFIRLLLGLRYSDTQCGAKIFRADAWRAVLPHIGITRFAFDVDLLFQLRRHGFRVIEEPTIWHDVAGSTVHVMQSSIDMFLAIVRMRLIYSPLKPLVRLYERTIAKPVEFVRTDPLFHHTLMLSGAAIVTHICNILFQMIVGRKLPANEYALLATFLALFTIVGQPSGTLSTAMNHYTSILRQRNHRELVSRLMVKWGLMTAIPSTLLAFVCILYSARIAAYFHLARVEPVIVAALALPAICVSPVFSGVLRGLERFRILALSSATGATSRLLIGVLFVYLVFPASGWALAGHVSGMYIAFLIAVIVLIPLLFQSRHTTEPLPSLRIYLILAFFTHLAFAFLLTGDVVMVRRYLPEDTTFAYAATLGRITVFLSANVVTAMFPKVASSGMFRSQDRAVYLRSLLYTAGFVAMGLFFCLVTPGLLLRFFYKIDSADPNLLSQVRWMSIVMALSALLGVNRSLLLAQRRFGLLVIVCISALLYVGTVHLWHPNAHAIIVMAGIANGTALLLTTIGILRTKTIAT